MGGLDIEKSRSSSCHHDTIYEKVNLQGLLPLPHFKTIWDYKNAHVGSIQRAKESFNWQYSLKVKLLMQKYNVNAKVLQSSINEYTLVILFLTDH